MPSDGELGFLKQKTKLIRTLTLKSIASVGSGHIGGALSVAELLAALYFKIMRVDPKNPDMPGRDKLVLSKGHAGPALYATLALKGFFGEELLYTLNKPGTILPSHCDMRLTPGIDMTTGSLGQGASSAAGLALAQKLDRDGGRTFLILGDGECQEGQVWEAFLFAAQRRLDNLTVFVDRNGLQIDGPTDSVCSLGDLEAKLTGFGCYTQTIDGHDLASICAAVENVGKNSGRPSAVVLNTKKGRGVSAFEDKLSSHHTAVTDEILAAGLKELEGSP